MDPILGLAIGLSMPMLFGFMLGYRVGKQAKSKEILEAMSRPTMRAIDPPSAPSLPSTGTYSRPMPEIVSTNSACN